MTTKEAIKAIESAFPIMCADDHMVAELSRDDREQFINFTPIEVKRKGKLFKAIMLEVPLASLDDDQDAIARNFFQRIGIEGPISMPCTYDGKNSHMTKSWGKWFDNARELARFAIEAFEAIYIVPPFPEYEFMCMRGVVLEDG